MEELASAKINLSLRVLGRRADNYHELESLVVFASCGDRLVAEEGTGLTLDVTGRYGAFVGEQKDNLVYRAAVVLREKLGTEQGALLRLEKNLPVASGIGGGSADAAACLRALLKLWKAELSREELAALALALGADVPVCLDGDPVMMRGVGELLQPVRNLPSFHLLLVNSGVAVSTAQVFRTLAAPPLGKESAQSSPPEGSLSELVEWLEENPNDLEAPAMKVAPEIKTVIALISDMEGCLLARMSGSGATCFGIFGDGGKAQQAANALTRTNPQWWVAVSKCG